MSKRLTAFLFRRNYTAPKLLKKNEGKRVRKKLIDYFYRAGTDRAVQPVIRRRPTSLSPTRDESFKGRFFGNENGYKRPSLRKNAFARGKHTTSTNAKTARHLIFRNARTIFLWRLFKEAAIILVGLSRHRN